MNSKIEACGRSKRWLAEQLGITYWGLYKKLRGETEFKASEIKTLANLLDISVEERDAIFFGDFVDKKEALL